MLSRCSKIGLAVVVTAAITAVGANSAQGQSVRDSVRFINPPTLSNSARVASKPVEIPAGSRMIFISGLVATDSTGKLVGPGDMHAQAKQVFENVRLALASVGAMATVWAPYDLHVDDVIIAHH